MIAEYDLIGTAGSCADTERLERAAYAASTCCRLHVKLDTGFGRFGFFPESVPLAARSIKKSTHLKVTGVFTHCGVLNSKRVKQQYECFMNAAGYLNSELNDSLCRHFCHSALALRYPEFQLDAVRVGSALLGRTYGSAALNLKPVGILKGRVQEIHTMQAGSRPGYSGAEQLKRPTRVAVVAAGWYEGFGLERQRETRNFRESVSQIYRIVAHAGKRKCAFYNGVPIPILGHGGANFTLLDVSKCSLKVGDWVTIQVNPLLVAAEVKREYVD